MKNLMKLSWIVAVALTTFVMHANTPNFSLRVEGTSGKTVRFTTSEAKQVNLSIHSESGETLFEETAYGDSQILRTYDLSAFPDGLYRLYAETSTKFLSYEISISNGLATITENPIAEVVKPMFVNKDKKVSLSIINKKLTQIEIVLYDENNEELYREIVSETVSCVKMFDFKNVRAGNFTFVTKYSNRIFSETVAVR